MTSDLADTSRVQENRPLENEKTPESSNEVGSNGKRFGLFRFRPYDDEEEEDWWFASTAIPYVGLLGHELLCKAQRRLKFVTQSDRGYSCSTVRI